MMKKCILLFVLTLCCYWGYGQTSSPFYVGGDEDKFYPVVFKDNNWLNNLPTTIEIGRSSTHGDAVWRGSVMARFRFHSLMWGHASHFVEADIYQYNTPQSVIPFVAGYHDATLASNNFEFIIWLRGNSTYHYLSNTVQSPMVYDDVQHMLPYREENLEPHTFKTEVDKTLNSKGHTTTGVMHILGEANNYFAGNVGIGTLTPAEKLAVNGNIRAKEIKVEAGPWPDYVFEEDYKLGSLTELEQFVKANKHLPGVPKAADVEENGLSIGEMNRILLQKVEELTLHLIEKDKEIKKQDFELQKWKKELLEIKKNLK